MASKGIEPYPVVDLFAGPGGLGEGFFSLFGSDDEQRFRSIASFERDDWSHKTLMLRHFFRNFPNGGVPDDYYNYLNGSIGRKILFDRHVGAYDEARKCALRISLGSESHAVVQQIIQRRLAGRHRWVLVGGPPCQCYSLVGRSRMRAHAEFEEDERHFLYQEYLKIIADHRPPVFVMENVKGLLSAKISGESTIGKIQFDLSRPGAALEGRDDGLFYRLYSISNPDVVTEDTDPRRFVVKAEDHGVPQARHRMFIVGVRGDLESRPRQLRRQATPTVRETIGDLPSIRSGLSRAIDGANQWWKAISQLSESNHSREIGSAPFGKAVMERLQIVLQDASQPAGRSSREYPTRSNTPHQALVSLHDSRLNVLTAHESRAHMASDLQRYMFAAVFAEATGTSPKLADFPRSLLPNHANIEIGRTGKMFSDRFRVQLRDRASTTITSHIAKDGHYFIHYDPLQCRSLTVREAARLQTFPDNYHFEGPRTAQYHQVGNAVPPYLAQQIAEIIGEVLDSIKGEE